MRLVETPQDEEKPMQIITLAIGYMMILGGQSPSSVLGENPWKFDELVDKALLARDIAFLQNAVADDMKWAPEAPPHATEWRKQDFLNDLRYSDFDARNVDSVQLEQHGDHVETRGHVQVKTSRADASEYQLFFLRTYERRPIGWQLVSHTTVRQVTGPYIADASPWRPPDLPEPPPGVYRARDGVNLPRLITEVKPGYTREAMSAKIQGTVILACIVRTDGSVSDATVIQSLDRRFGLDDQAIKAAKQWRFLPGTRNGNAVDTLVSIAMNFTLR
jgi:TonB family protein